MLCSVEDLKDKFSLMMLIIAECRSVSRMSTAFRNTAKVYLFYCEWNELLAKDESYDHPQPPVKYERKPS